MNEDTYYGSAEKLSARDIATSRETEIEREYQRLMKAIDKLGGVCASLGVAFAPVLRESLEKHSLSAETVPQPSISTEHGNRLAKAREDIERITSGVMSILERKEI